MVGLSTLPKKLLHTDVEIARIKIGALIDTGASSCFIHAKLWRHVSKNASGTLKLVPSTFPETTTASGRVQQALRSSSCTIRLSALGDTFSVTFPVIENQLVLFLLGGDIIIRCLFPELKARVEYIYSCHCMYTYV